MSAPTRPYDAVKRALDVLFAAALLVLLLPLMALVIVLVAIDLGRPILFRQVRPGRLARPFTLLKFRTMRMAPTGTSDLSAVSTDVERLTPIGRLLRSTSLDELPQLVNVLRGDMSFVGPRPLLMEYLLHYNAEQTRRHEVRPGITGLAQVSGRNAASWNERFALDARYVDERSFALDASIVARTLGAVLSREGVGSATTTPFVESSGGSADNPSEGEGTPSTTRDIDRGQTE